ncbi:glycosyltransferase family 2 protein [Flavobacteriaceae bacterium TP-CH-4]|uniref:Glycosyltransferase family 2 protein n=1 Tax=Pelagihabitans pacificus TaxID=2696054 RepID=A0A967ARL9_9FLAO|nr:glycosyltransferase family 2 protein [Pelagihabitans pacificus]NHF59091.1 glycosyltransferase family 2 protein [Pelagihabitans pacificus]
MKISVCMATYNGAQFLREQLDSVLKQLSANDELIISDDGSTDRTVDIIESYADERIQLFHSTHQNLIFNFENALKRASGDLIFLCDQDDIWFDNKVEKCVHYLKKYALVFSNAAMFQGEKIEENELFFKDSRKKTGTLSNLIKVKFLGATMAFRRAILERALPFPRNLAMHDIWLGMIAETTASTFYIDEPLIYYRRHQNTASTAGNKSKNSLYTKIKIRYDLVINLCKRVWFKKPENN